MTNISLSYSKSKSRNKKKRCLTCYVLLEMINDVVKHLKLQNHINVSQINGNGKS